MEAESEEEFQDAEVGLLNELLDVARRHFGNLSRDNLLVKVEDQISIALGRGNVEDSPSSSRSSSSAESDNDANVFVPPLGAESDCESRVIRIGLGVAVLSYFSTLGIGTLVNHTIYPLTAEIILLSAMSTFITVFAITFLVDCVLSQNPNEQVNHPENITDADIQRQQ